ncbi:Tetratricopeptide repeat protein [Giardia lamblia P15]|uniref:Tetratricopeptide repeat protein n=1 Tax=Giardia intestinalis (strain P15) TaxID=658858 RepID=E1EZY3_GIAIA|nr:Tetratricopeptide repeat protein [Giardia lamblia P15]
MYADRQRKKVMERDAQIKLAQGDKLAKRGLWLEAVALYTESIDLIPTNAMTFFNRAKCYFEMHDYHRYVFDISLAIHIEPTNYVFYVARSHGFYMLKKVQEALKDLDYAISETGSSADLFFRRGVCYYDLRRWSDSINDFSRCLEINPAHPSAYSRRGAAYLKLKNGTLAIDDLRKSVNVSSRSLQHKNYFKLAIANLIIGDALAAVEAFSAALEIARNYRAELISKQKAKASKVATYGISGIAQKEEEEKVDIKRIVMTIDKVRYQLIAFEDNETFNIFDDAVNAEPPKYTPMAIYTPSNKKLEQLSSEKAELEATEKCFPEYLASRGKAKALLGRHSEALQDFSESISYSPNNPQTYYERSNAFRIMGFYENALRDIEFCAHRKLNADIAYAKAIICENIGELEESLVIYEAILAGLFSKPYTADYLQSLGDRGQSSIDAIVELSLRGADETMMAAEQLINETRFVKMIELDAYVDDLTERSKRVTNYPGNTTKPNLSISTGILSDHEVDEGNPNDKSGLPSALISNTTPHAQEQIFGKSQRSTVTADGKVFPKPRFFHLPSLYHAALLYRQKLNFERAAELIRYALSLDPLDDKLYELLAILHYDALDYHNGIACVEKVIEIQSTSPTGVFWETYYLLGMCHMKLQNYSKALECMILAQKQPAGGAKEPLYKQIEAEKINGVLASLPPGSNIAIAYLTYAGSSAIPRDPLSPTSAARGYRAGQSTQVEQRDTSPNSVIFPLLDLSGALPGCNNLHVLLRKAECLFYLSDYIGCIRSCSLALKEFNFSQYTHRGVRLISTVANLIRNNKPLRQYDLAQVVKTNGNVMSQEEIASLSTMVEVPLNGSDKEYLFNVYFLRARALAIINRLERAVKDAFRARHVYLNLGTMATTGIGALLYFMSRTYAFLRLYTKSYHCARDAIKAGLPYYAISRAHYMQGVALMYTNRKELAAKCFSLALKTSFTAKFAGPIFEKLRGEGIIVLPSLEEVAHFVELYKEYDPSDYEHFPKVIEKSKKKVLLNSFGRESKGPVSRFVVHTPSSSNPGSNPGSRPNTGRRLASSSIIETFGATETRAALLENRDTVVHRMPTMQCLPITGTEAEFNNKIVACHNQRIDSLEKQLVNSRLWVLAAQLDTEAQNFDEFLILTNRLHQPENEHILRGPLRFATTNSWVTKDNVFYLHERAKCLQELGLHELATDDFTSVLRFQPTNDRAFFRRGFSLRALGMIDEAALDFEKAKKLRPDIGQYHLDYENMSQIGYLELVPYGQEEFYNGETNIEIQNSDPEGLYSSDTYPPLPDEQYLQTRLQNTHFYYINTQDVFDMVRTLNDSIRLRRQVESPTIPLTEEDTALLNNDMDDIPPDASVSIDGPANEQSNEE